MYSSSVADTVSRLLSEADPKVAAAVVRPALPPRDLSIVEAMQKVAQSLRDLPEPALSYPVLHVVKTAMAENRLCALTETPSEAQPGSGATATLRKVANALRSEDLADHSRLLAQGAHTLKASRGLMLLRELVRE